MTLLVFAETGEDAGHFLRSEFSLSNIPDSDDAAFPGPAIGNMFRIGGGEAVEAYPLISIEPANGIIFRFEDEIVILVIGFGFRFAVIDQKKIVRFPKQIRGSRQFPFFKL